MEAIIQVLVKIAIIKKELLVLRNSSQKIIIMNQSGAAARFATRFRIGYRFSMVLCMLSEFRSPQYIAIRADNILFKLVPLYVICQLIR